MYYSCFTATVHSPRIFFFNWYLLFSSQSLSTLSVIEEFLSKCDVPFYPGRVTDPLKPVRWAKNKSYFSKEKMYKIKCVLEICKGTYMYHRGALRPLFQDQTFGPFGGRNNREPGEKPSQQDDNQQQNQLTKGLNLNLAHTGWRQVLSALPHPVFKCQDPKLYANSPDRFPSEPVAYLWKFRRVFLLYGFFLLLFWC